tara:strand:+ start:612 stop:1559 length:948 start_codon:yes stop_codon:yes gene_type:complete
MSLLTVDQIQYNGGTALTLPTTTPAAGDMLQTNGSGVLSWRDRLQKVTNAAGTVTYTVPANIQAGKALGTAGGNTLGWYSAGGDPMQIGSHTGWRLADKADFNSIISSFGGSESNGANTGVGYIDLLLPSGVNASDVSSYYMEAYGLAAQNGSWYMNVEAINSSGNNIANSQIGTLNQTLSNNYGANYDTSTRNKIRLNNGPSGTVQQNGSVNTTYGDWNALQTQNSSMSFRDLNFQLQHYNAKYDFDGVVEVNGFHTGNSNYNFASSIVYQGRGNQGNFVMSTDYTAGFKLEMLNGGSFKKGTVCLYYCLNDGA